MIYLFLFFIVRHIWYRRIINRAESTILNLFGVEPRGKTHVVWWNRPINIFMLLPFLWIIACILDVVDLYTGLWHGHMIMQSSKPLFRISWGQKIVKTYFENRNVLSRLSPSSTVVIIYRLAYGLTIPGQESPYFLQLVITPISSDWTRGMIFLFLCLKLNK